MYYSGNFWFCKLSCSEIVLELEIEMWLRYEKGLWSREIDFKTRAWSLDLCNFSLSTRANVALFLTRETNPIHTCRSTSFAYALIHQTTARQIQHSKLIIKQKRSFPFFQVFFLFNQLINFCLLFLDDTEKSSLFIETRSNPCKWLGLCCSSFFYFETNLFNSQSLEYLKHVRSEYHLK